MLRVRELAVNFTISGALVIYNTRFLTYLGVSQWPGSMPRAANYITRGHGAAEFVYSNVEVIVVVGFILFSVIISGGDPRIHRSKILLRLRCIRKWIQVIVQSSYLQFLDFLVLNCQVWLLLRLKILESLHQMQQASCLKNDSLL